MKKANAIDKFLDFYKDYSSKEVEYVKVYNRPSKFKCIIMFGFTLFILIALILFFLTPSVMFALIFIIDLIICLYYGYNLFSKNGFALGRTVAIKKEEEKDE